MLVRFVSVDNNFWKWYLLSAGRYHEGYSESGGYGQYDATPFQTVPGSGSGAGGGGVGGDQWGVGLGDHLSHHPAFLAGLGPRDSSNPHHPTSITNNADQKPLLQSPMLASYAGRFPDSMDVSSHFRNPSETKIPESF